MLTLNLTPNRRYQIRNPPLSPSSRPLSLKTSVQPVVSSTVKFAYKTTSFRHIVASLPPFLSSICNSISHPTYRTKTPYCTHQRPRYRPPNPLNNHPSTSLNQPSYQYGWDLTYAWNTSPDQPQYRPHKPWPHHTHQAPNIMQNGPVNKPWAYNTAVNVVEDVAEEPYKAYYYNTSSNEYKLNTRPNTSYYEVLWSLCFAMRALPFFFVVSRLSQILDSDPSPDPDCGVMAQLHTSSQHMPQSPTPSQQMMQ